MVKYLWIRDGIRLRPCWATDRIMTDYEGFSIDGSFLCTVALGPSASKQFHVNFLLPPAWHNSGTAEILSKGKIASNETHSSLWWLLKCHSPLFRNIPNDCGGSGKEWEKTTNKTVPRLPRHEECMDCVSPMDRIGRLCNRSSHVGGKLD